MTTAVRTTSSVRWALALFFCAMSMMCQGSAQPDPACANPCYAVANYWPYKTCRAECSPDVCNRGWGAWESEEVCCSPGVAFKEGCGKRPDECWVVESFQVRTCIRDDRKCLQGSNVWGSQQECCAKGAAFPEGCRTDIPKPAQPCWVVDLYFPARLCKMSETLCGPEAGVQSWPNRTACCQPGAAFSEGCSANGPQAPCYIVDTYWPERRCRLEQDIAECSRGWGVYESNEICCAPNVGFPEGCSPQGTAATTIGSLADGSTAAGKAAGIKPTQAVPGAAAAQPRSIRVVKQQQPKIVESSGP